MRNWRHLLGTSPVRVEPQAVMLKYFAVSADSAPLGEQSLDRTAFLAASIEGLGRNFAPYPLLTYDIAVLNDLLAQQPSTLAPIPRALHRLAAAMAASTSPSRVHAARFSAACAAKTR